MPAPNEAVRTCLSCGLPASVAVLAGEAENGVLAWTAGLLGAAAGLPATRRERPRSRPW